MLARIRKAQEEEGFTLIELLVVIIIIGILAAIAIPVFLNQRKKGWDAAVKSDLRNLATSMETYNTDWGHYPNLYDNTPANPPAEDDGAVFTPSVWSNYKETSPGGVATTAATLVTSLIQITVWNPDGTTNVTNTGKGSYCLKAVSASDQIWIFNSNDGGIQPKTVTDCIPPAAPAP